MRGAAARLIDERDTAQLELAAAHETFRSLGAEPDARRVAALLGKVAPSPLSSRDKEIGAELFISAHTVARHLSNIYTKLGVGSRSTATAFAYEHALI